MGSSVRPERRQQLSEEEFERLLGEIFPEEGARRRGEQLGQRLAAMREEFPAFFEFGVPTGGVARLHVEVPSERERRRAARAPAEPGPVETRFAVGARPEARIRVTPIPPIRRPGAAAAGVPIEAIRQPAVSTAAPIPEEEQLAFRPPPPEMRAETRPRGEFTREYEEAQAREFLERARKRARVARAIESTLPGHVVGGEETLRAVEGAIEIGTLPVRAGIDLASRIPGMRELRLPPTPGERRRQLEAEGLIEPTTPLPDVAQAALSPLGIETTGDLAEFIGSLPALGPVFGAAGAATQPLARSVGRRLLRAGFPRPAAEAAAGFVALSGTVGGGSGALAGAETLAAGGELSEAASAALETGIEAALGGMVTEGDDLGFGVLGAMAGLIRGARRAGAVRARRGATETEVRDEFLNEFQRTLEGLREEAQRSEGPTVLGGTPEELARREAARAEQGAREVAEVRGRIERGEAEPSAPPAEVPTAVTRPKPRPRPRGATGRARMRAFRDQIRTVREVGGDESAVRAAINADTELSSVQRRTLTAELERRPTRHARMEDDELEARLFEVMDRAQEASGIIGKEVSQWTRFDDDIFTQRSGTAITRKGGRAIGRLKDDGRIMDEVMAELQSRGVDTDAVIDRYLAREGAEVGATRLRLAATLAMGGFGAATGAALGARMAPEDAELRQSIQALIGAGVGYTLGASLALGGAAMLRRIRRPTTRGVTEPGARELTSVFKDEPALPAPSREIPEIDPQKFFEDPQYRNTLLKAGLNETQAERLAQQIITGAAESGHYPKRAVSWEEARQTFDDMGLRLEDIRRGVREKVMFNQAEVLGLRDTYAQQARMQVALERALQDPKLQLTAAERQMLELAVSNLDKLNRELIGGFLRSGTEHGRALNAHRAMARVTMEPADWWLKAQRELGDRPLTDVHRAKIQGFIDRKDSDGLAGYITGLRKVPVPEYVTTIWKSFLLGRFPTHFANTGGNLTFGVVLENLKDAPALLMDHILRMTVSGVRTKTLSGRVDSIKWGAKKGAARARDALGRSAPYDLSVLAAQLGAAAGAAADDENQVRGALFGLAAGIGMGTAAGVLLSKSFRKAQKRGLTEIPADEMLKKYDVIRRVHFDNVVLETAIQAPYRQLVAGDQLFRFFAIERSLRETAEVMARNEGLKGAEREARVKHLMDHPTTWMGMQAAAEGEYALFQNEGILAAVASGIKRAPSRLEKVSPKAAAQTQAGLEFVIPFTRTPANLASRTVEYSPFGYLRTVSNVVDLFMEVKRQRLAELEKNPELLPHMAVEALERQRRIFNLQRTAAETFGRASLGAAPIILGIWLAADDLMTSWWPQNPTEAAQWRLEGRRENSIRWRGKWVSVERVSPLGNLMMLGAAIHRAVSDPEKSWAEKALISIAAIPRSVAEQSFLIGLTAAGEAFRDPERRAAAFGRSLARSLVPGPIRATAQMFDVDDEGRPIVRPAKTIPEAVISGIPGIRKVLPAGITQFGETATLPREPWQVLVDPFSVSEDRARSDPVLGEMRRLGYSLPVLKRREAETDEEFLEPQRAEGKLVRQAFEALLAEDRCFLMDDETQLSTMGDVARAIKTRFTRRAQRGIEVRAREMLGVIRRQVTRNLKEQRLGRTVTPERLEELIGQPR